MGAKSKVTKKGTEQQRSLLSEQDDYSGIDIMSDSSTIPYEEEASKAQKGKGKNVQPRTLQLRSDGKKEETVSKSSVDRGGCTSAVDLLQQMIVMNLQAQQRHERDTILKEQELQLLK